MARRLPCSQDLNLHDGAHRGSHEFFWGGVEVSCNDDVFGHAGDKGDEASPKLCIDVSLNALSRSGNRP